MRRISQVSALLSVLTLTAACWAQAPTGQPRPAAPGGAQPAGARTATQPAGGAAASLAPVNPAELMPSNVLVYAEIGSPGEQVGKIANMLKGTPLANPLVALGGGRTAGAAPTAGPTTAAAEPPPGAGKTPADIAAALLNPAMLEEFKKIRGLAVGLTGLPPHGGGSVPMIAVLYPGASDAIRGLITAYLLMTGQPGEPIEGLQTVVLGGADAPMVAYDNDVFIAASSAEQLKWCVRQYKLAVKGPSLATANKSFSQLTTVEGRRSDALTIWADPATIFKASRELMPGGRMPGDLAVASVLLDFNSLEGAVLRLVLDERKPYVEAVVAYKDGHQAVGYDLVRTPALSKDGFEAVPANAVGVLAFALGDAQEPGAKAQAGEAVKRLTGLDIGRELFANIEQVNLFLMPISDGPVGATTARRVMPSLGLALTSKDPARTRMLLDELLRLPRTVIEAERTGGVAEPPSPAPAPRPGEYALPMNGQSIPVYLGQAGRSTVLAFEPAVLNAALAAAKAGPADGAKGSLHAELERVPAGTCKMALVSAGSAVQAYAAIQKAEMPPRALTQPSLNQRSTEAMLKTMGSLSESLAGTSVMLSTVETPNRITVRLSVANLSPLAELFSLLARQPQP